MSEKNEIFISENDFRSRYQYSHSDLLGEGGFAQVYKAYDKQFNEYVALKFYNKGEQGKYDVLHEMKDSRKYSHKNILRVHDAFVVRFEHTGGYSLVQVGILEYANGGNLRDFMNTKPSETKFVEIITGILSALEYLHTDKKIIHRDLSPENILMYIEGDNWIPKVADFGISKKLEFASDANNSKKSTQLLGKVTYMAPEQFYPEKYGIHEEINTNVDLWAFGVILYELFTQRKPFGNDYQDNVIKTIQSITTDPLPSLDEIPERYRVIIKRCLVKDANKRVKNAGELVSILNTPTPHTGKKLTATLPIFSLDQNKRRLIPILAVIIGVLSLSIGGYVVYHKKVLLKKRTISTINTLMDQKKYDEAILYIKQLPSKLKSQKLLVNLYNQSEHLNKADSLRNIGEQLLNGGKYDEALQIFNEIVVELQPDDSIANYRINKIKQILDSLKKENEVMIVAKVTEEPEINKIENKVKISYKVPNRTFVDSSYIENQLSEAAGKIVLLKNKVEMLLPNGALYNQTFYNNNRIALDTLQRNISYQEQLLKQVALFNSNNYFVKITDYNKANTLHKEIIAAITKLEIRIETFTELVKQTYAKTETTTVTLRSINETSARENVKWMTKSNVISYGNSENFRSNFEINLTKHFVKHTIQGKSTSYSILVKGSTKSQEKTGEYSYTSETQNKTKYLIVINMTKKTIMIIESTGGTELNGYLYHLIGDIEITKEE
jgi:serine/threonine protein kinase